MDRRSTKKPARPKQRKVTATQQEVLAFIEREIADGAPPTMREIQTEFGYRSVNAAHQHVLSLQKKGLLYIRPKTTRGIRIVKHHVLRELKDLWITYSDDERKGFLEWMFSNKLYPKVEDGKPEPDHDPGGKDPPSNGVEDSPTLCAGENPSTETRTAMVDRSRSPDGLQADDPPETRGNHPRPPAAVPQTTTTPLELLGGESPQPE